MPFGCLSVRLLGLSVCVALFTLYGLICASFGLFGCLLLSVVVCIVSFKAIFRLSVALSFRLGTFIRLGLFRAVVGQNNSVLFWFGVVCARVIIIYYSSIYLLYI